jgi:hypothetical protein
MRRVASGELAHVRSTQGSSNNGKIPQATATLPHYLTDVQTGSVEREAPGRDEDARREGAYHATECDDHRHGCGSVHRVRRYGRLRPRRWGRRPRWQSEWRFRSGSSGSRIQRHPRAGWCSGRIADQTRCTTIQRSGSAARIASTRQFGAAALASRQRGAARLAGDQIGTLAEQRRPDSGYDNGVKRSALAGRKGWPAATVENRREN